MPRAVARIEPHRRTQPNAACRHAGACARRLASLLLARHVDVRLNTATIVLGAVARLPGIPRGRHLLLAVLHLDGCTVRTSVKVRHYVPDAVVSSYSNTGENPWRKCAR
jgi:hypothetical protein